MYLRSCMLQDVVQMLLQLSNSSFGELCLGGCGSALAWLFGHQLLELCGCCLNAFWDLSCRCSLTLDLLLLLPLLRAECMLDCRGGGAVRQLMSGSVPPQCLTEQTRLARLYSAAT